MMMAFLKKKLKKLKNEEIKYIKNQILQDFSLRGKQNF